MSGPEPYLADRDDRLTRWGTAIIAAATLVGGLVGYLQATASSDADDLADRAQRLAIEATGATLRSLQDASVDYETYILSVEQRTHASNATQRMLNLPDETERLRAEQARWEALAAASEARTPITAAGPDGPQEDPAFPSRFFSRRTMDASRILAEQDAANEALAVQEGNAASYTAGLAVIAVALYLVGLSLALKDPRIRLGFMGVSLALTGLAVALVVDVALRPTARAAPGAAEAYAEARLALETAFDQASYAAAEAAYDRVIELRPTFGRAYVERADAIFSGSSPQRSGFPSLAPAEALERARADLERAVDLGLESASVRGALGFYAYLQGVQEGRRDVLEQSISQSRRAMELDPGNPIIPFNLGVALLAAERIEEADAAYLVGMQRTLFVDAALTDRRDDPFYEQQIVAGALTDLEILRRYRPDLGGHIDRVKTTVVTRVSGGDPNGAPPASTTSTPSVRLDVYAGQLQWYGDLPGYAETDVVTTEWYYDDPRELGWSVIAAVSGEQPVGVDDGNEYVIVSYLDALTVPECLPDGSYRVEVYAGDHLASTGEAAIEYGDLEAYVTSDLGVRLCRPSDWVAPAEEQPGLLRGTLGPDGDRGVYLLRIAVPGSLRAAEDVSAQMLDIGVTSFGPLFPGTPVYDEASGTTDDYFMGLADTARRWYTYEGGWVRAGAGLARDGSVVMGFLFGPEAWFDEDEPYRILESLVFRE